MSSEGQRLRPGLHGGLRPALPSTSGGTRLSREGPLGAGASPNFPEAELEGMLPVQLLSSGFFLPAEGPNSTFSTETRKTQTGLEPTSLHVTQTTSPPLQPHTC